jgi:hypothetical protein
VVSQEDRSGTDTQAIVDFGGRGPASREASVDEWSGELSDSGGRGPAPREASVDEWSGKLSGPKGERHGHRDD